MINTSALDILLPQASGKCLENARVFKTMLFAENQISKITLKRVATSPASPFFSTKMLMVL